MPWPVHPNGLLGASGDNDAYRIERSLRFNSADSAYLNRTPASASNRKTWTWSGWVKRGTLGGNNVFMGNTDASGYNGLYFQFDTNNNITIGDYGVGSYVWVLTTSQVFRDTSSWYHIVATFDSTQATASDRVSVYINGTKITAFSTATYPSLNLDGRINSTQLTSIGRLGSYNGFYFDGYITEINFIDGQALTPSSFGETDAITGRWKAKAYSGTYGTNGFYLKFADNSSTAALGTDSSGNGNTWTTNNFSVTAGAGNDSLVDSPTNYGTDAGVGGEVRGNYATLNPLQASSGSPVASNGNLRLSGALSGYPQMGCTFGNAINGFKGYFEVTLTGSNDTLVGFNYASAAVTNTDYTTTGCIYVNSSGNLRNGASTVQSSYLAALSTNDVIMVAFDFTGSNKNIWWGRNGTWGTRTGLGVPSTGAFPAITVTEMTSAETRLYLTCGGGSNTPDYNFGQRPFAYTAPTGFKALCTTNLPTPTIKKPSSYFDVLAYTGTGASNSISSLGFSPDLVWIKNRGGATSHAIYDTTRGSQNQLSSDTTGSSITSSSGLTSFNSNGFTLGTSTLVNTSGTQYVAWAWDEAPIAGMDIVSYSGTGAIRTVAHNLGVAPKMIIAKLTNSAGFQWPVYHSSLTSASSYIWLNSTNAQATDAAYWGTAPTSSVFSVGTNANVGLWRNTASITSVTVTNSTAANFSVGSTFTLYGILKA